MYLITANIINRIFKKSVRGNDSSNFKELFVFVEKTFVRRPFVQHVQLYKIFLITYTNVPHINKSNIFKNYTKKLKLK
jgi:hypothetical protein